MGVVTLAAVGDIALARRVEGHIREAGPGFPFEMVADSLRAADVRFGSVESVFLDPEFPKDEIRPRALAGEEFVWPALREGGFDVLNLAANHALDCGRRGLANTLKRVREAGVRTIGAGDDADEAQAQATVERNGMRIGFVGYQEPCNGMLEGGGGRIAFFGIDEACERVRDLAGRVDALVVSLHADMEFRDGPSLVRVEWCRRLVDAGATVVLCHHPHVPQGIEMRGKSLIAYSLGNFVFDVGEYQSSASLNVHRSHILKIEIDGDGVVGWRREHLRIREGEGRPYPLAGEALAESEAHFAELDAIVADEARLRKLWHESSLKYFNGAFQRAMKNAATGEEFLDKLAWRFLCNSESRHWACGVLDMARERYEEHAHGDFEFCRPNNPFEE